MSVTSTRSTRSVVGGATRNAILGPGLAIANRVVIARKGTLASTTSVRGAPSAKMTMTQAVALTTKCGPNAGTSARMIAMTGTVAERSGASHVAFAKQDSNALMDVVWTFVSAAELDQTGLVIIGQTRFINHLVCVATRTAKELLVGDVNPAVSVKRATLESRASASPPRSAKSWSVELINRTGATHSVRRGVEGIV